MSCSSCTCIRSFKVTSKEGLVLDLLAKSKAAALNTAAELLDEEVKNLSVHQEGEW